MTPRLTRTSEPVWLASATRISLPSFLPTRRSHVVMKRFTHRVPIMMTNETAVTLGAVASPESWANALEPTRYAANSSIAPIAAEAYVSYFPCP